MDELKNFIEKNRTAFEDKTLQGGDIDRLFAKINSEKDIEVESDKREIHFRSAVKRRKVSLLRVIALPVAALLILLLSITLFMQSQGRQEDELTKIYLQYCQEVSNISSDIDSIAVQNGYYERGKESIDMTIDNINFEAIPLASQLPEEMPDMDKIKIMKEYYSQKLDGIRRLKTLVSETMIEENN